MGLVVSKASFYHAFCMFRSCSARSAAAITPENFCDVVAEGGGGPRAADLAEAAVRKISPKTESPKMASESRLDVV